MKTAKPKNATQPETNVAVLEQVAPEAKTPREIFLAKVSAAISAAKGQALNLAVPLLEKALKDTHDEVPSPDFGVLGLEGDAHKATRTKMLTDCREKRAALGFQVAARVLNDAIAAVNGATVTNTYGVRQLTTGGLVSVETIRHKLLSQKKVRGISIR